MYHISNDLRAKKSAEKIYRSLRHILFNKASNILQLQI